MNRALVAALLVGGACYSPQPPAGAPCGAMGACPSGLVCTAQNVCEPAGSGSGIDAPSPIDGPGDGPASCTWHTHFFDACATPMPLGDIHLTSQLSPWFVDTGDGIFHGRMGTTLMPAMETVAQQGAPDLLVLSVTNFILDDGATLRVTGTNPLAIAAHAGIVISGDLDVSSHHAGRGAGGSPVGCGSHEGTAGANGTGGAGGGGGGGFQGAGGAGGMGDSDTGPNAGGVGGAPLPVPMVVQGGCEGGSGGLGNGGQVNGGAGGGAIQLTAHDSILISSTGTINAGGGGGIGGGILESGGSGGGAGGFIGLEAPAITFMGTLAVNGGGGGGGANDTVAGTNGTNGQLNNLSAAGGTNSGGCGTSGGGGSSTMRLDGFAVMGTDTCAGGGGGGGAGYILVFGSLTMSTGLISPAPTVNPF